MELNPPLHERSDEQIKEIMRHPKHYRKEVVELAVKEAYKRGFTEEELKKLLHAGGAKERYQRRVEKKLKDNESHFGFSLLFGIHHRSQYIPFFILFWPLTVFFMIDQSREGRNRMFTESAIFIIIGIVFWCILLANFTTLFPWR